MSNRYLKSFSASKLGPGAHEKAAQEGGFRLRFRIANGVLEIRLLVEVHLRVRLATFKHDEFLRSTSARGHLATLNDFFAGLPTT